jgi:hypothetical protein
MPPTEVLNGDAATTPVTVIEAKGHNSEPKKAEITRGITQAHAHIPEVNLGSVAAPAASITNAARAQARNLNVRVIAVDDSESARVVESVRVTGDGEFSPTIDAVRLQATTHRLTVGSYTVNYLKTRGREYIILKSSNSSLLTQVGFLLPKRFSTPIPFESGIGTPSG